MKDQRGVVNNHADAIVLGCGIVLKVDTGLSAPIKSQGHRRILVVGERHGWQNPNGIGLASGLQQDITMLQEIATTE
jgi:hypothetical protein